MINNMSKEKNKNTKQKNKKNAGGIEPDIGLTGRQALCPPRPGLHHCVHA